MSNIIDLQETSPNHWKAKYRGNYGTYTIKIEIDGKSTKDFSCSCPSDYYPCKHIPMVQEAINERIANSKKRKGEGKDLFEDVVRNIPLKKLQEFVVRFGLHNPAFQQAILLEFTPKQEKTGTNHYSDIIRRGLSSIDFDYDDIYEYQYDGFDIDVLDKWLSKAREYVEQGNYPEAILIAKACIEEYAEWLTTVDFDPDGYVNEDYVYEPFNILKEAYKNNHIPAESLLDYCKEEVDKKKYGGASMKDRFEELIMNITEETDPEAFLAMQDRLFNDLTDKSSYKAEAILKRKIDFYKEHGDVEAARRIVEENLQIESFRKEIVKEMIANKKFANAKKLINEHIREKGASNGYYDSCWDEYLLEIARKENDSNEVRRISRRFINTHFHSAYYKIYKSTFPKEAWPAEMEKLIKHYRKGDSWFSSSIADLYVAEKRFEDLLAYLTKYPRTGNIEQYHKHIASLFPGKTLALFKQAIDGDMKSTGRDVYENAVRHFASMLKIEGGRKMVNQMIEDYKIQYRNRRAMIEIFERFSKSK